MVRRVLSEINKHPSVVRRNVFLARYYCITGQDDEFAGCFENFIKLNPDVKSKVRMALTLLMAGSASKVRSCLAGVSGEDVAITDHSLTTLFCSAFMMNDAFELAGLRANANLLKDDEDETLSFAAHVKKIMEDKSISEADVVSMLDLAGSVLHRNGYLVTPTSPTPNDDGLIVCHFHVNASPGDIAELEWEFVDALFETMPNAPYQHVQIGYKINLSGSMN